MSKLISHSRRIFFISWQIKLIFDSLCGLIICYIYFLLYTEHICTLQVHLGYLLVAFFEEFLFFLRFLFDFLLLLCVFVIYGYVLLLLQLLSCLPPPPPSTTRCASAVTAISGLHSRQQQQQQEPLKTSCKQIEQQINKKEKLSAFLRVFNGEFYFQYSPPSLPSLFNLFSRRGIFN